jgi:O-6-methylguanine DNA methyltransferase
MAEIFTPIVLTTAQSDWGPVHIAAGAAGIVAAGMLASDEAFRADLARRGFRNQVDPADADDGPATAHARRARIAITAFLDGEDVDLTTLPLDLSDLSAWDRRVYDGVRTIPRGSTASYGEVARRVGAAGAARAVGGAVGRCPIGLLVPCHRVIAGDGTLGGYGTAWWGGVEAALDLKHALLRLEDVEVRRR